MIPGGVGFLLGFFILLHTSQNIFAELLRFGDRQFYKVSILGITNFIQWNLYLNIFRTLRFSAFDNAEWNYMFFNFCMHRIGGTATLSPVFTETGTCPYTVSSTLTSTR
jgi:hypothetical protein